MSSYVLAGILGFAIVCLELLTLKSNWRRTFRVVFATAALFAALTAVLYLIDHPNALL